RSPVDESGRTRPIRNSRIHRPDAGGRLPVYVYVPRPLENHEGCDEGVSVKTRMMVVSLLAVVSAWVLLQTPRVKAQAPVKSASDAVLAGDSITGKVIYSGPKPLVRTISMEANAVCAKLHPNGVPSPEVILNPDNTLRNALVYVKSGAGLAGKQFPAPAEAVKINQTGCMFEPHVVAVMVNQRVEIANADPSNHNVHVMAETNPAWNVTQTPQAPPKVAQFAKPEIGLVIMCNIHPWMRVYA